MQNLYMIKIFWEFDVLFQKPLIEKPEALLMYEIREEMGPY